MNSNTGFVTTVEAMAALTAEQQKAYTKLTEDEHRHVIGIEQAKRPAALKRYRYERRRKNRAAKRARTKNR